MREIKIRAKPDKTYFFESDIRASPSIGEAAYAKGQKITNTKAAIKREQCQMTEQREQNDACIGYVESRRSSLKAESLLSIAEREQAQRIK